MTTSKKNYIVLAVFVLPALVLYTLLCVNPILQTIYMSFFSWNGIKSSPMVFEGLRNYAEMFSNENFYRALKNVGAFIVAGFLLIMPTAFTFACVVTSRIKAARFFKTAFFIPVVLPLTAVGLMWQFLLKGDGGLINTILTSFGIFGEVTLDWLGTPSIAIFVVVVVNAWIYSGLNMIIFSAGMVAIPEDIYQAAEIDGATGFNRMRYITIPLMRETFKIFTILNITQSLRVFSQIYVMTGGGPNGATDVPTTLLYNESFKYNHFGMGNSIGTFIVAAALIATIVLNYLMRSRDD